MVDCAMTAPSNSMPSGRSRQWLSPVQVVGVWAAPHRPHGSTESHRGHHACLEPSVTKWPRRILEAGRLGRDRDDDPEPGRDQVFEGRLAGGYLRPRRPHCRRTNCAIDDGNSEE